MDKKSSVTATEAQNNFGAVLQRAAGEGVVFITRYDRPTAVVLSPDRYRELVGEGSELPDLEREFDDLLARMQTTEAASAVDTLFEMDSADLGAAAARATREMRK